MNLQAWCSGILLAALSAAVVADPPAAVAQATGQWTETQVVADAKIQAIDLTLAIPGGQASQEVILRLPPSAELIQGSGVEDLPVSAQRQLFRLHWRIKVNAAVHKPIIAEILGARFELPVVALGQPPDDAAEEPLDDARTALSGQLIPKVPVDVVPPSRVLVQKEVQPPEKVATAPHQEDVSTAKGECPDQADSCAAPLEAPAPPVPAKKEPVRRIHVRVTAL